MMFKTSLAVAVVVGLLFMSQTPVRSSAITSSQFNSMVLTDTIKPETHKPDEKGRYTVVEAMPEFPGGLPGLGKFLTANMRYPAEAQKARKEGTTYVQFVVSTKGKVTEPIVTKSSGDPGLDAEALRVVKLMPKWKPGTQKGEKVPVRYTLPIKFKLN